MVRRKSVKRERELRELGEHIQLWRKVNGLSAARLAERAAITRETLRNLENGTGAVRIDSLFAVFGVLGISETILNAADPHNSSSGRTRMDDILNAGGHL